MLCNGVVNFISLIGVFIGLAVVNLSEVAQTYIMVFVAGNFIYIASDIWQHIIKNKGESAKCGNVLEFFGLSVGIGSMFALTLLEH
jgi:zinc transporter ZupT